MPPNYANGKIYSIRSYQTDLIYIGSTTQSLSVRMAKHRSAHKQPAKKKKMTSGSIIEYGDAYIELIEEYKCDNKMELLKREGEIIRATDNTVNKNIAGRTLKEYYIDNQDELKAKAKQYRINNPETTKQSDRQYREHNKHKLNKNFNCVCGGKYTHLHHSRHCKTQKHINYLASLTEIPSDNDSLISNPPTDSIEPVL
jgi:hypothetical protein